MRVYVSRYPNTTGDYICDGIDDHVEIQAAIDYAEVTGGGTIFIKESKYCYCLEKSLNIPAIVKVHGLNQTTKEETGWE